MKTRYLYAAASLIALTAVTLWTPPASAKDSKTEQNIVVTINGTTISQAEIDADIQQKLVGAEGKMPPEQLEQIKKTMQEKAVEYLVTKTLLNQECAKNKITASPEEVDKALDEMRKSLPENVTFEDALKASGITLEFLKSDITFKLMVNKLFEANVKETPPPTDAQIKEFYERTRNHLKFRNPYRPAIFSSNAPKMKTKRCVLKNAPALKNCANNWSRVLTLQKLPLKTLTAPARTRAAAWAHSNADAW